MANISEKIKKYETQVEEYKTLRAEKKQIEKNIISIETNKNNLEKRIQGVKDFEHLIKNIDNQIKRFEPIARDPHLHIKVSQFKQTRLQKIFYFLANVHKITARRIRKTLTPQNRNGFQGLHMVFYIFIQLILTVVTYLYTNNDIFILLGFGFFLGNVLLLIVFNFLPLESNVNNGIFSIAKVNNEITFEQLEKQTRSQSEDQFLVNVAWYNALQKEKKRIDQTISAQLEGGSFEKITTDIKIANTKIKELQDTAEEITNKMLSPEEYLKLRRDLDILKIEMESMSKKAAG